MTDARLVSIYDRIGYPRARSGDDDEAPLYFRLYAKASCWGWFQRDEEPKRGPCISSVVPDAIHTHALLEWLRQDGKTPPLVMDSVYASLLADGLPVLEQVLKLSEDALHAEVL